MDSQPANISIFLATHLLFFTSSIVAALVFYLHSRPHWREVLATFLGGVALTWTFGLTGVPYVKVMVFLSYWAACALVVSFVVPFFSKKEQLKHRVTTLERMVAAPLLEILGAVMLGILNRYVPETLDYYLYAFDTSFGYPPGFLTGQMLATKRWLGWLSEASYINLTLGMAVAYLIQLHVSPERAQAFVRFVVTLGMTGFIFYIVFPAAGTEVLFPGQMWNPPDLASVSIAQMPDPREPRNCIPSLHTAWALAIWWTIPRKLWYRIGAGIFSGATLLYTLACGHYLADMIAAVPFAIAIYSFTLRKEAKCWRIGSIAMALFLGWLVLLRFGVDLFLLSPAVPFALCAATIVVCEILRRQVEIPAVPAAIQAPAGGLSNAWPSERAT